MKDRKTLGHNDLINEVTKLLANRFSPQPQMIKRRIEQLIEVRDRINSQPWTSLKTYSAPERIP
jgi:Cullin protein neddylation domain